MIALYSQSKACLYVRQNFTTLQGLGNEQLQELSNVPHPTIVPSAQGLHCLELLSPASVQSNTSIQKGSRKSYQTRHTGTYAASSGEDERANNICCILVIPLTTPVWGSGLMSRVKEPTWIDLKGHASLSGSFLLKWEGDWFSLTHFFFPSITDCLNRGRGESMPFLNVFSVTYATILWVNSQGVPSGQKMIIILGHYVSGPEWN